MVGPSSGLNTRHSSRLHHFYKDRVVVKELTPVLAISRLGDIVSQNLISRYFPHFGERKLLPKDPNKVTGKSQIL